MKLQFVSMALCAGFLSSCGIGSYSNPEADPSTLAKINCTARDKFLGLYPSEQYTIESIDNKPVYYGSSWTAETKDIYLTPNHHNLTVQVFHKRGMSPFRGIVNVPFDAKAGQTYRVNGTIRGVEATVWLEHDGSKKKATAEKNVSLEFIPPPSGPIFIPIAQ